MRESASRRTPYGGDIAADRQEEMRLVLGLLRADTQQAIVRRACGEAPGRYSAPPANCTSL